MPRSAPLRLTATFRIGNAQPDCSLGVAVPPYLRRSKAITEDLAWFQGSIKNWDAGLGRIRSIIDTRLATNTLLIVTTDHGIPYPRAKASLYDAGIETMLLMRYPPVLKAGTTYDELISNVDILPTVLDAVGGSTDGGLQGRSCWPLLTASEYQQRDRIFAERTFHTSYDPVRCARHITLQVHPELRKRASPIGTTRRESNGIARSAGSSTVPASCVSRIRRTVPGKNSTIYSPIRWRWTTLPSAESTMRPDRNWREHSSDGCVTPTIPSCKVRFRRRRFWTTSVPFRQPTHSNERRATA